MATYLEDATQTLGVTGSEYDEEIYAPVSLSSTTRRALRPTELAQARSSYATLSAQIARERDAYYDAQYDQEMERRAKAAAWNDKVKSQQQGAVVAEALIDLDPTSFDYQERVSELRTQYPMGFLSDFVKSTMEGKDAVYKETYEARKRAEEQRISRENSDYNREQQLKVNRITGQESDDRQVYERVSKLNGAGVEEFEKAVAEGDSLWKAESRANLASKGEVDEVDFRLAVSARDRLRDDIRAQAIQIAALDNNIALSPDKLAEAKRPFEREVAKLQSEMEFWDEYYINPYTSKKKKANPKSEPNPENDAPLETPEPDKPAKKSVPGELKPDFTPISLSDIERRTGKKWAVGQVIENNGKQYVVTK